MMCCLQPWIQDGRVFKGGLPNFLMQKTYRIRGIFRKKYDVFHRQGGGSSLFFKFCADIFYRQSQIVFLKTEKKIIDVSQNS